MKFNPIQLNIFKTLLNDKKFKINKNSQGRPPIQQFENVFKSILFKVKTGVNWEDTKLYGKYSSSTVYKYFKLWSNNNLFDELYKYSLKSYSRIKNIKWKYQAIDSTIIKAFRGGESVGPNNCDRGRNGSKIHTLTDKYGIPLAFMVTKANYHDSRAVIPLLKKYKIRRPRYAQHMNMDGAYDTVAIKRHLTDNLYIPHVPKNKRNSHREVTPMSTEEKEHFKYRNNVEQQFGHLKQFKSFLIRFSRKHLHFENLINIVYSTIICKKL